MQQGFRSKDIKDLPALLQYLNHEGEEEAKTRDLSLPEVRKPKKQNQPDSFAFTADDEFDPAIKIGRESGLYLKRNYVERYLF